MPSPDDEITSHDLPAGSFAPHGEFRVRHRDGVMFWVNRGPFNLEALQRYALMRQMAHARWVAPGAWIAGVVHWQVSALMSPEAFEHYRLGLERALAGTHRLAAVAWVCEPELEGMAFMRERFLRLLLDHGLPVQEFDDLAQAEAWARAQLAARQAT